MLEEKEGAPNQMELITLATSLWMVCLFSLSHLLFFRTTFLHCLTTDWQRATLGSCLIFFSLQLFLGQILLCCLDFVFLRFSLVDWYWSGNRYETERTFLLSACLIWKHRWYLVDSLGVVDFLDLTNLFVAWDWHRNPHCLVLHYIQSSSWIIELRSMFLLDLKRLSKNIIPVPWLNSQCLVW